MKVTTTEESRELAKLFEANNIESLSERRDLMENFDSREDLRAYLARANEEKTV